MLPIVIGHVKSNNFIPNKNIVIWSKLVKCDYAHRYFLECWTEVTASKVEFWYIANSHILCMSPYTSGDHHDVSSVGLYNKWDETKHLTFVRSKWQRDLESGTRNRDGDMYCSNDTSFSHC